MKQLHEATKKFNGHAAMRPDGDSAWKLRGMKSSLRHFQVMGASRMRDLEKADNPSGGILADDMGLGKTVMAIANIVDGRPDEGEEARATLIVAPSSLIAQWKSEIAKHAEDRYINRVMIYRSSKVPDSSEPELFLTQHDIVITSYHEVMKSMPDLTPPPDITDDAAKARWVKAHFEANKGALHRVKWHRLVLDEAHAIKNHTSKTSIACWKLRGKFRWTLSGTPVQNSLSEFFSFFSECFVSISTSSADTFSRISQNHRHWRL
jgi:SNF2 family DNA or RNA helicase